jgi:hypothetical protein
MKKLNIDEYILKNYKTKTNAQMAQECGCNKSTISNHRKHLGISATFLNSELRNYTEYICQQYGKKTSSALSKELNCSISFIKKIWQENNVSEKYKKHQVYSLNENYFKIIDTDAKAYFLGFIAADGCIYKRNNHQAMLSFSLKDIDVEVLENLKKELNTTKPICITKQTEVTTMATLQITSDILCSDLINLGLGVRKTFDMSIKEIMNNIPIKFWNSFILGYFDGDGSIDIPVDGTISKSHVRISGPVKSLENFKKVIEKVGILGKVVEDKRQYKEPFGSLEFTNTTNKYLFLKFIYSSYKNSLTRKKEIVEEFFRRVEQNVTHRSENTKAVNEFKSVVIKWEELLGR